MIYRCPKHNIIFESSVKQQPTVKGSEGCPLCVLAGFSSMGLTEAKTLAGAKALISAAKAKAAEAKAAAKAKASEGIA